MMALDQGGDRHSSSGDRRKVGFGGIIAVREGERCICAFSPKKFSEEVGREHNSGG